MKALGNLLMMAGIIMMILGAGVFFNGHVGLGIIVGGLGLGIGYLGESLTKPPVYDHVGQVYKKRKRWWE